MKKSQAIDAIDRAAVTRIEAAAGALLDSKDGDVGLVAFHAEIDRLVAGYGAALSAIDSLDFDGEDRAPADDPPAETDDAFRARILEEITEGSIHRGAAEVAVGLELDLIAGFYELTRGKIPEKKR